MSTEPEAKKPAAAPAPAPTPYAEEDKLGPVPGGSRLGSDLRATLVAAFRAAIGEAQDASKIASTDEAVHELRKAVRRARATVDLVAGTLSRDDRKDLRRALADTRRLLSATRDLAVAPEAIAMLTLDDASRAAGNAVVTTARATMLTDGEIRGLVHDAAARVAPLADVLAAALPPEIDWADLSDGLATTYRRARKDLGKAKRSRKAFHGFRKRTKELTYQLELLAGGLDGAVEELRRPLVALGEELGAAVDMIMLRGFLDHHGGETPAETLAPVYDAIDIDLGPRLKAARRSARPLFERRARRFARKVRKAVRKDHAPPADPAPPVAQA